jgi:hypothetical protein
MQTTRRTGVLYKAQGLFASAISNKIPSHSSCNPTLFQTSKSKKKNRSQASDSSKDKCAKIIWPNDPRQAQTTNIHVSLEVIDTILLSET